MWWLKIHRWLGLATLIPMAILGVTGSAQVWPEETEALLNSQREVAATADPAQISQAHIAAAREALAPYGAITSVRLGAVGEPIIASTAGYSDPPFGIGAPGGMSRQAYVDPETAEVIDNTDSSGGFMWYMHFIHGLFLIPGWGRQLVGIMGLFLTVSAATGLWVFWPGKSRFLAGLKWQKRDGFNLNLHRQSGVILSIVIIVEAISGAWISFPGFFASIVDPGVEQPVRRRGPPPGSGGPQAEPLVAEDGAWIVALEQAQGAVEGRPTAISVPMGEDGSWTISFAGESMNANVSVPLGAGELSVQEAPAFGRPPPSTRAGVVAGTMREVHYALTGGIVWEVLVFLSGIALTFLSISGVYVWARRKFSGAKS